ncbi:C99L2 protein, partial [Cephalopterus ornatus]|nr:C99L2 protein [Cephalopterus ornatus]
FDDSDLFDGSLPKGGGDGSDSNGFTLRQYNFDMAFNSEKCIQTSLFFSASQGAIAGIVSAVAATVIGAVSSFIAYQKKKLCFKQSGKNS